MSSRSGSDFYDTLAGHYDELFGSSESGLAFLAAEGARPGRRVLDVACGTGAWTRQLVDAGVDAYGIDLSQAMIDRARDFARDAGIDPGRFTVADMLEIDAHRAAPFDIVFCIGNSIAHLPSIAAVEGFVAAAARAMADASASTAAGEGGSSRLPAALVLQYVSVGEISPGEDLVLPPLVAPGVVMERVYRRAGPARIRFDATLSVHGDQPVSVSQDLLVIDDEAVRGALERAGLRAVEIHGGFDRSPPTPGSWVRVARGRL